MEAPLPPDEAERLAALRRYEILDTLPEEAFDRLTRLAAQLTGAPVALVSFVDTEWQRFKSRHGLEITETPRGVAFCAYTILAEEVLIVEDARRPALRRQPPRYQPDGHPLLRCRPGHDPGRLPHRHALRHRPAAALAHP